jgi:hypothetical protein
MTKADKRDLEKALEQGLIGYISNCFSQDERLLSQNNHTEGVIAESLEIMEVSMHEAV